MNTETDQIYVSPTGNREVWLKGQAPAGHTPLEAWLEQNPEPPAEAPPVDDDPPVEEAPPVDDDPPVLFIRSDEVTIAEAEALYLAAMGAGTTGSGNAGTSNAGTSNAGTSNAGTGNAGVAEAFIIGKLGL